MLTHHVVPGKVLAKDVQAGEVTTVQGGVLRVATEGGVRINDAKVVKPDVIASNGVIHVIDTVVPPNL